MPGDPHYSEHIHFESIMNMLHFIESYVLHGDLNVKEYCMFGYNYSLYELFGDDLEHYRRSLEEFKYDQINNNLQRRIQNSAFFAPIFGNGLEVNFGNAVLDDKIFDFYMSQSNLASFYDENVWSHQAAEVIGTYNEAKYAANRRFSFISEISDISRSVIDIIDNQNIQATNKLLEAYETFSSQAQEDLRRLVLAGSNKRIFIPPISAIALSRSENLSDLGRITQELRDEFVDVRNNIVAYENRIADDSLSLKDSLSALNDLDKLTMKLGQEYSKASMEVSEWRDLTNFAKLLDGGELGEYTSITSALLNKPAKLITDRIKDRKVRYLYNLKKNFYNIKNYGELIQKVFKIEISYADLKKYPEFNL